MLQKLNDRIQGLVTWVIVGLITLTFILFGLDYFLQSRHEPDAKVQVNAQVISKQDFELNYHRMSQMQDQDSLTTETERTLKQQVLSEMIVNLVSVESARRNGFEVDNNQAVASILLIPQFQEDGHFSTSRYTQALTNAFFTPQTFQQEVRQGMLLNQQRFALIGTSFVLPNETKQFVRLSMQTRDYRYAILHAKDYTSQVTISEKDILDYYNTHKEQFYSKEMISLDYIHLSLQEIKKSITVSPEAMLHYYEDNKTSYLTPAQWQLAYIRIPLKNQISPELDKLAKSRANSLYELLKISPDRFDSLAQMSTPKQPLEHGLLPVVIAGASELDQQLVHLTKPNQLSHPIRTKLGYDIYKLISYQPSELQSFVQVKALIEEQLTQELAQKQYSSAVEQLTDLSYQNPDSLDFVADSLKMPIEHTALFTRAGGKDLITQNKSVIQVAFGQDVLVYGNNSEPIQLDSDDMLVLRVKQHVPAVLQDIKSARTTITKELTQEKATLAAKLYADKIVKHESASDALKSFLQWHIVASAGRDGENLEQQLNQLAFEIPHVGDMKTLPMDNGNVAIVQLSKINDTEKDTLDKEQSANITQQLEASYGLLDYDLYINQLMHQAKIVKHF